MLVFVAEAGDALREQGVVWAALEVEAKVTVFGEALQKGRGGNLLEEGSEAGGGADGDETATAWRGGVCCDGVSFLIAVITSVNSTALGLTSFRSGGSVRAGARGAVAAPIDAVPAVHHGSGGRVVIRRRRGRAGPGPLPRRYSSSKGSILLSSRQNCVVTTIRLKRLKAVNRKRFVANSAIGAGWALQGCM
jgi:hypothetical protein